jgi:exonuclease SbcC
VKRLRCDIADPDAPTEVALELTVAGHRLRLVRSPEYQRPKKRGDGFTPQPAKASLTWVGTPPGGQASEGAVRIDEVNRTVQRLLGMNAEQFFQVVLLPQGEFARFLRADTEEREKLLEKLFGTQRFADVERWLREHRQERGRELEQHRQTARELIARVAQAAGEEPPQIADEDWLASVTKRLVDAVAEAAEYEQRTRMARDDAEAKLANSRALADQVRRVRAAHEVLAECAAQEPQWQAWVAQRDSARRAVAVVPLQQAASRLAAELEGVAHEETVAATALHDRGYCDTDVEVPTLRRRADGLREQAGGLAQLVAQAQQQATDIALLSALDGDERDFAEQVRLLDLERVALPADVQRARERLDAANHAAARLDGLLARRKELERLESAMRQVPVCAESVGVAAAELRDAIDRHQAAREDLLGIRQRRLDGMAAELAGRLTVGNPCPVCGSVQHPAPATAGPDAVSEADERKAVEFEQETQQRRAEAARRCEVVERKLAELREDLAGWDAERLATDLHAAAEECRLAQELAALRDQCAVDVGDLEERSKSVGTRHTDFTARHAQVSAQRAQLADTVAGRARQLEEASGDHPDVIARRAHLLEVVTLFSALADARQGRHELRRRLDEASGQAVEAATGAGFAQVANALAAARTDAELAELDRKIAAIDTRAATARSALAEPELAGLGPAVEVDLGPVRAAADDAREKAESAVAELHAAQRKEHDVAGLVGRLRSTWTERAPAEAAFAELSALTDVVNGRGQNARRMSLRSYVLAARLEEVAMAASRRLQRMSQGRYSFAHSVAGGAHGTRGGLGLDVLDDYSGQLRPAKTLSGGESFLASLSLALGLADVVAAETGGALLDTLFVDEGFGTLDGGALDLVMDTLDELRAGGRVVGLVSHVEELRQRIPVQLHVRKARSGSTLTLTRVS